MIKVGWNYGQKELCPLCADADDTQDHLLNCSNIADNCDNDWTDNSNNNNEYNLKQHIKRLETAIRKCQIALEEKADEKE